MTNYTHYPKICQ